VTTSDYGRYRHKYINCVEREFGNFNRNANEKEALSFG